MADSSAGRRGRGAPPCSPGLLRVMPGRGQLARAGVRVGRRHRPTSSHEARAPGSGDVDGTGDTWTTSSPGARRSSATPTRRWSTAVVRGGRAGHDLRSAYRGRGAARRGGSSGWSPGARGAPGVLGDRGGDDRDPPRPGGHRARPDRQVRRLLPRPLRRAAGGRRQRGGDARPARLGRVSRPPPSPRRSSLPTTASPSWTAGWRA